MDVDAIVAAADAMEQWLRREDPDVCRLMFRSSIEALAEAAAPILVAAGRRQAAADALRDMADRLDRGPAIPLPPSVYSALIRERAADIAEGRSGG